MAILINLELDELRRRVASELNVDWTKPQINVALQAAEDWFETNKVSLLTSIDSATAPKVFTIGQKRRIATAWLKYKFSKGVN